MRQNTGRKVSRYGDGEEEWGQEEEKEHEMWKQKVTEAEEEEENEDTVWAGGASSGPLEQARKGMRRTT